MIKSKKAPLTIIHNTIYIYMKVDLRAAPPSILITSSRTQEYRSTYPSINYQSGDDWSDLFTGLFGVLCAEPPVENAL